MGTIRRRFLRNFLKSLTNGLRSSKKTAELYRNPSGQCYKPHEPGNLNQLFMQTQRTLDEFRNEPFTDFSKPENADAMRAAIEKFRGELGREYPIYINGEDITLDAKFTSYNPANKTEAVAVFSEGDTDTSLVDKAVTAAN